MKRKLRKGVSPILATLILVAIVFCGGLAVYLCFSGFVGGLGNIRTFDVVAVDLVKTSLGGVLSVSVRNTGSITAAVVAVSIATDVGWVETATGSTKTFYLICVDGLGGSWVSPAAFCQATAERLTRKPDAETVKVSTLTELGSLVRNPSEERRGGELPRGAHSKAQQPA